MGASDGGKRPPAAPTKPAPPPLDRDQYFGAAEFDAQHFAGGSVNFPETADPAKAEPKDVQGYFGTGTFDAEHFSGGLESPRSGGSSKTTSDLEPEPLADLPSLDLLDSQNPVPPKPARGGTASKSVPASRRIDDASVRLTADFGPTPTKWHQTPRYAGRVWQRQRALRVRIRQLSAEFEQAELRRDQALADLAIESRASLESHPDFASLYAPLAPIDQVAGEQRRTMEAANAEHQKQLTAGAGEIGDREHKLAERKQAEHEQAEKLAQIERSHARAEAGLKRIHIEIRGVTEQAQRAVGPQGGRMPPELHAKLEQLHAQVAQANPALEALGRELESARALHASIQNEVQHLLRGIDEMQGKRRALVERQRHELDIHAQSLSQVEGEQLRALAEVGRAIAERAKDLHVYIEHLARISATEQAATQASREHQKHLLALDVYDAAAVARGRFILIALFLVLVGLLAMLVF
jgi:hypothetical protein